MTVAVMAKDLSMAAPIFALGKPAPDANEQCST
jgi:hypothetical protein